jgi:hypothetical protein
VRRVSEIVNSRQTERSINVVLIARRGASVKPPKESLNTSPTTKDPTSPTKIYIFSPKLLLHPDEIFFSEVQGSSLLDQVTQENLVPLQKEHN